MPGDDPSATDAADNVRNRAAEGGAATEQPSPDQGGGAEAETEAEAEAEVAGNAASASNSAASRNPAVATSAAAATDAAADAATDADADADADAGDSASRSSASQRNSSGHNRGDARNVNVVIVPDAGATVACLLVALSQGGGLGPAAPTSVAQLLESLIAQQRETHQRLVEALQTLALKSG
ncbi:hypothetical protein WMF31_21605 [Sorangium sp. So ce1036]|uniref:hypothetical protein n=1 Tax=Sorangium sp. So ce1036 TaxID=3133328 RepID=UPI003F08FF7D